MERVKQIARGTGKVILALLGGILMPILIWVALGVAVNQWVRERRLQRESAGTVGKILADAGLTFHWQAPGGESMAAALFMKQPMSEIRGLLARAGL